MIDYTLPLDQLPDPLPIEPLRKPFDVTITPPGSKSITCRAYVLAALAHGESKIIRPLRADDTEHLLKALCTLGAEARWVPGETHDGEDVYIKGVGGRFPRGGNLYMGEGGTPTRFMIACACLSAEPVTIDASPRMRERPIAEGVDMLRQLGAKIEYVEAEGRLPVRVVPSEGFVGGEFEIGETESSQFVSALLLIAPHLLNGVRAQFARPPVSKSYLQLTLSILSQWNLMDEDDVASNEFGNEWTFADVIRVSPFDDPFHDHPVGYEYCIEPDASSAVYWFAAAAITGSRIAIERLDLLSPQPDRLLIGAFERAGSIVETRDTVSQAIGKPWRTRIAGSGHWGPQDFHGDDCPDGSLLLAACAGVADRTLRVTGLRTLRVKETDRIAALANELRKVGCTVETGEDWISITPQDAVSDDRREEDTDRAGKTQSGSSSRRSSDTASIIIETYNDHRMAMAFAVLGLARPGGKTLAIRNPRCVAKSYPTFWRDFAKLYQ